MPRIISRILPIKHTKRVQYFSRACRREGIGNTRGIGKSKFRTRLDVSSSTETVVECQREENQKCEANADDREKSVIISP